ncbi:hypothetical protein VdG1_04456 [Verticillium dahliae VDG1]|nr:hypothetical protein VdG1_04456 [Verticillium dahliae VDG1]
MLSSSDSVAWLYPHAVLLAHLPDNQSVRFQLAAAPGARAGSSASTRWPCAFTRMAPLFKSRNLRAPSRPTAAVASAAAVQGRALTTLLLALGLRLTAVAVKESSAETSPDRKPVRKILSILAVFLTPRLLAIITYSAR